jgi:hypothetical protein
LESSTTTSSEQELKNHILQSLRRRADVDDLTFELCKQTGWDWKKASDFINSIRSEHGGEIDFLWAKVFSILGIACIAIGLLILFYFFDVYVGWNNVALCLQHSFQGHASATSSMVPAGDCLFITSLGMLETFGNHYGYIAVTLIIGGFAGFIIAQRQMKSTLGITNQVEKES